jgi:glycosyltransferase involved in cell wall biosynthesis
MNNIKVSIITPVFNCEKYIRSTIESVLNQSYKNIEYIIVDGGSSDRTLEIINEYKSYITHIISEPDLGMYDAINKGIQLSSGTIISYINADDLYFDYTVETIVEAFQNNDIDFCFGNFNYIDSNGIFLNKYYALNLNFKNVARLYRIPFSQQTTFWSKELFYKIGGFDIHYKYVADTKFFLSALYHVNNKKMYIDKTLAMFRKHDEGFSNKEKFNMGIEHDEIMTSFGIYRSTFFSFIFQTFFYANNKLKNILYAFRK